MKKLILLLFMSCPALSSIAQVESAEYYLPKTEMRFKVLVEKSSYTPGEFATYSERFLRKPARTKQTDTYRIAGISMYTTAIPDSAKLFTVPLDKKHTVFSVERDANGVLLAINSKGKSATSPKAFVAAPKSKALNPHDFMSEAILSAATKSKMAELTAQEIYDIRSSRDELSRGEAEYMPQDGEQLKIMLANLAKQEDILTQTFQGVTVNDTTEVEVVFCPKGRSESGESADEKAVLFRFSKKLGLLESDDLAGAPYYINIENLNIIPELETAADGMKPNKKEPNIMVNMPGKIKATITEGNNPIKIFELYTAQHGRLEALTAALFGRKMTSHLQLNPITGNVELLETEPLE